MFYNTAKACAFVVRCIIKTEFDKTSGVYIMENTPPMSFGGKNMKRPGEKAKNVEEKGRKGKKGERKRKKGERKLEKRK